VKQPTVGNQDKAPRDGIDECGKAVFDRVGATSVPALADTLCVSSYLPQSRYRRLSIGEGLVADASYITLRPLQSRESGGGGDGGWDMTSQEGPTW